jgi:hypothetical protein
MDKVYAYIARADKLLVFKHVVFPEAGIQIPGGNMDAGETPKMLSCEKWSRRRDCKAWY